MRADPRDDKATRQEENPGVARFARRADDRTRSKSRWSAFGSKATTI